MMLKERQNDKRIQHDKLGESPTNSSGLDVSVVLHPPAAKKLQPAPAFVLAVESAFVSGGHTDPHESESVSGPAAAADQHGRGMDSHPTFAGDKPMVDADSAPAPADTHGVGLECNPTFAGVQPGGEGVKRSHSSEAEMECGITDCLEEPMHGLGYQNPRLVIPPELGNTGPECKEDSFWPLCLDQISCSNLPLNHSCQVASSHQWCNAFDPISGAIVGPNAPDADDDATPQGFYEEISPKRSTYSEGGQLGYEPVERQRAQIRPVLHNTGSEFPEKFPSHVLLSEQGLIKAMQNTTLQECNTQTARYAALKYRTLDVMVAATEHVDNVNAAKYIDAFAWAHAAAQLHVASKKSEIQRLLAKRKPMAQIHVWHEFSHSMSIAFNASFGARRLVVHKHIFGKMLLDIPEIFRTLLQATGEELQTVLAAKPSAYLISSLRYVKIAFASCVGINDVSFITSQKIV